MNTAWANEAGSFSYSGQSPTNDDLEKPGRNFTWSNALFADSCNEPVPEHTLDSITLVTEWDYEGSFTTSPGNSPVAEIVGKTYSLPAFDSDLGKLVDIRTVLSGESNIKFSTDAPVHFHGFAGVASVSSTGSRVVFGAGVSTIIDIGDTHSSNRETFRYEYGGTRTELTGGTFQLSGRFASALLGDLTTTIDFVASGLLETTYVFKKTSMP